MNFTTEIKKEIISKGFRSVKEKKAALTAFIRTSGVVGERDGVPAFFIVSETENVAEFFSSVFESVYGETLTVSRASIDRMSGKGKLVFEYTGERSKAILTDLGLLERTSLLRLLKSENERLSYISGAFLGGGSCLLPNEKGTGYHLEFVFSNSFDAEALCKLLLSFELIAKTASRSTGAIAYVKSKETISDFLAVIGAEKSLGKLSKLVERRDEANRNNRAANCFSGNADKTVKASVRQVLCIEKLEEEGILDGLESTLKETARARYENPTMSMTELANLLKISKSCLNHRLRKLTKLAEENKGKEEL